MKRMCGLWVCLLVLGIVFSPLENLEAKTLREDVRDSKKGKQGKKDAENEEYERQQSKVTIAPNLRDPQASKFIGLNGVGELIYKDYSGQGDKIPDFSTCGYGGGGVALPDIPVKIMIKPQQYTTASAVQNDSVRFQKAIDALATLPLDKNGFRGAILVKKGVYWLEDTLYLNQAGIVLRGEGHGKDGTVFFSPKLKEALEDPEPLILVSNGERKGFNEVKKQSSEISQNYVPVGSNQLKLKSASKFKVGDEVVVTRTPNDEWIDEIDMKNMPSKSRDPGNWSAKGYKISYPRMITDISGNNITIHAPIVCAIDQKWGGGFVQKIKSHRLENVGIENIRMVIEFNPNRNCKAPPGYDGIHYGDEVKMRKSAVNFHHVKNGWARDIYAVHFNSLFRVEGSSQRDNDSGLCVSSPCFNCRWR